MADYDIARFLTPQETGYPSALVELRNGHKESHWMWYMFPQVQGLGFSFSACFYGISCLDEAREYLKNETLREHLLTLCETLLALPEGTDISCVMGFPDDLKLCSCMTLFAEADSSIPVFQAVLDRYYDGKKDERTLEILAEMEKQ